MSRPTCVSSSQYVWERVPTITTCPSTTSSQAGTVAGARSKEPHSGRHPSTLSIAGSSRAFSPSPSSQHHPLPPPPQYPTSVTPVTADDEWTPPTPAWTSGSTHTQTADGSTPAATPTMSGGERRADKGEENGNGTGNGNGNGNGSGAANNGNGNGANGSGNEDNGNGADDSG